MSLSLYIHKRQQLIHMILYLLQQPQQHGVGRAACAPKAGYAPIGWLQEDPICPCAAQELLHRYYLNTCPLFTPSRSVTERYPFAGFTMIGTYIACTAAGLVVYYITAKKVKRDEIEMRSAQNVIFPLLIAERDREFLRQLRRNRDEEAELMKNVPGWEVS